MSIKFVKKGAKKDPDGRIVFSAPISKVYPFMADHIVKALAAKKIKPGDPLYTRYLSCSRLGAENFALVTVPKSQCPADKALLRAAVLEECRLWFTEMLHQSIQQAPMRLVLEPDDLEFKL